MEKKNHECNCDAAKKLETIKHILQENASTEAMLAAIITVAIPNFPTHEILNRYHKSRGVPVIFTFLRSPILGNIKTKS